MLLVEKSGVPGETVVLAAVAEKRSDIIRRCK